jgi:hypothetical protein
VLGTDGFGRSDFRARKLREHFEVNRHYIVVAALKALAEDGAVPMSKVAEAIAKYGIATDKDQPAVRLSAKENKDVIDRNQSSRYWRLQRRGSHRGAGQGGRYACAPSSRC